MGGSGSHAVATKRIAELGIGDAAHVGRSVSALGRLCELLASVTLHSYILQPANARVSGWRQFNQCALLLEPLIWVGNPFFCFRCSCLCGNLLHGSPR